MSTPLIWVFGDTSDGQPTEWTLELVSEARRLADQIREARVAVLSDGRPTLGLGEQGADIVALTGIAEDGANPERRDACRWALKDPAWSLVLVPNTPQWLALARELAAEASAAIVTEATRVETRGPRELALRSAGVNKPVTVRLGIDRAIVSIGQHVFELGPQRPPVVDVRRARIDP